METRKEYDLAFSLGQACACSLALRKARMQFASFPFDWIAGETLPHRVDLLLRRFDHWLEKEDFEYKGKNHINGLGRFFNKRTGLNHLHDFVDGPIEQSYDQVVAKYARREKRLFELMEKSRRVLLVYINLTRADNRQIPSLEDVVKARADIAAAFPNAAFDFMHFIFDKDIPYDKRVVTCPAEGVTEVRFDYHNDITDVGQSAVDALVSLGITVRDYRTNAERNAYRLKKKMNKYQVDTRMELFVAKMKERFGSIFSRTKERK